MAIAMINEQCDTIKKGRSRRYSSQNPRSYSYPLVQYNAAVGVEQRLHG